MLKDDSHERALDASVGIPPLAPSPEEAGAV
jgi:hypothetical protein